jgi:glycine cleavage system regulatory protein
MTVIGDDRPGLVESVSHAVANHDGNWLDSRMSRLAGKFAAARAAGLETELNQLASSGLQVIVESGGSRSVGEGEILLLELIGDDHPGIVRDISRALAGRKVNIEELQTETYDTPMSGGMLFKATARVGLPAGVSSDDLRQALEALGDDLMVRISLEQPA